MYDITSYIEYHPGGVDELMRGAGIDSTELFNSIHKWVNFQNMLKEFFVGYLVSSSSSTPKKVSNLSSTPKKVSSLKSPTDISSAKKVVLDTVTSFRYDCYQSERCFTLIIYSKISLSNKVRNCFHYGYVKGRAVKFCINCMNKQFLLNLEVHHQIKKWEVRNSNLKFEIILHKNEEKLWSDEGHHLIDSKITQENEYRLIRCTLICTANEYASHDTRILSFALEDGYHVAPPLGCHVYVIYPNNDHLFGKRPYTVYRVINDKEFQLLVKTYENGIFSSYLGTIRVNQHVGIEGFDHSVDMNLLFKNTSIVFLAAGTGISPFYRILNEMSHNNLFDNHTCNLLFYNKTQKDILVKKDLEELQEYTFNLKITHILSQEQWSGLCGHVCNEHLENFSSESLFLVCGPKQFMECVSELLLEKNVHKSNIFEFKG